MALEFREPNITKLQRSITWRQFRRWCTFNRIHPIDSRERIDAAIARATKLIAGSMGAKDLKEEDINLASFQPGPDYIPPHSQKPVRRKPSKDDGKNDLNTIISALGASDGSKRR